MKLDKSKENISAMFDDIADRYDFLNHTFTANLDKVWRRKIINYISLNKIKATQIIDLASGTGDMAVELLKLEPQKIYSFDISPKMLELQRKKISNEKVVIQLADSENMPVESGSIDIVTISFGIRNFESIEKSLKEIYRVLKPDGMLIVLEMFSLEKRNPLFEFYFTKIMPVFGRIISRSNTAYAYLHTSVMNFKTVKEFVEIASNNGFVLEYRKNNFRKFVYSVYLRKFI
ncbi:MAG: ubiquinone/menaquinone biosynthesis methyltransferase [Candidatus Kapaibacterium sp.]